MIPALVVLLLLLVVLGGGGFALHLLWLILIVALALWAVGFLMRGAEGTGRWYRW
jgi:hypothetical protein